MQENDKLEILEAVHALAGHVDEQFSKTRTELLDKIDDVRTELKSEISSVRTELKSEISSVRTEMRDGFDRVETLLRKEDKKTDRLTEKLLLKGVIDVKGPLQNSFSTAISRFRLQNCISSSAYTPYKHRRFCNFSLRNREIS